MTALSELNPKPIWQFFEKICSIPHPSYHEQALAEWIMAWAQSRGLNAQRDEVGNIILRKAPTTGMEDRKPTILQAHLDMVPQANSDSQHNFTSDPIDAYVDGEWVTANGTTLGSDNGIGLSSILAVFDADDIAHGPLEALLTMTEEAGMDGAFGLKPGLLNGEILLNTDSEQEGEVYMGCAGGGDTHVIFHGEQKPAPVGLGATLTIKGLKGGHSGCDIHTGRANANKLMARLLNELSQQCPFALAAFNGGNLRNAIPREAHSLIVINEDKLSQLEQFIGNFQQTLEIELGAVETNLTIAMQSTTPSEQVFTDSFSQTLLRALNACPNGVISMSQEIEGVVETSLNLGVVETTANGQVKANFLVRSLVDSHRSHVEDMLASLFKLAGADVHSDGGYPGWKPDPHSPIMDVVRQTYADLYGSTPNIMVIHAGLECGLFKTAYPHWDMASFGPTIKFPHSPDEKVNIASVEKYWQLLLNTLKNIPKA
ncbi:aminoacyl-histidine dipeptidase [Celerinatantimonas yamalensis]|uniref:Aminoacyl-histidine dipeptidase n=1 Tax=Celerinatantimonas yamalensis TaxID=559956 RepID=A0ABW9GAX0_9GAMM